MVTKRYTDREQWAYSRLVCTDPLDAQVVTRLKEWIATCDSKHQRCRSEQVPQLPARIIDIGSVSSPHNVNLVETSDGDRAPYIALSHCWGKSNSFITTKDNIEQMKKVIPIEKAPATFQHAIAVSRALGIRYLWIDSLCIIQGDLEDWQIQSARMGIIYRDSTITLAASNSASDDEGFLKPRQGANSTLKFISPEGESAEIHMRTAKQSQDLNHVGKIYPLDRRAWCLQEAYLPSRFIKFLDNKILWRCQTTEWDEARDQTGHDTGNAFTLQNIFRNQYAFGHRTYTLLTPYQGWYRMVTEYTKRNLTYISDRLPAIAGLAALVAEHDGGKYCSGIWWEDVAFGICWKKCSELERIDEYIAPSWSWASVKGPVEFVDANERYFVQPPITLMSQATFHNFYSAKRGLSDYAQIDMAWVSLEAPMTPIVPVDTEAFRISGAYDSEDIELSFDFETTTKKSREGLNALFILRRRDNSSEAQQIQAGTKSGPFKIILFGLIVRDAPHLSQRCKKFGLESNAPVYERFGFFRILTSKEREDDFWDKGATPIVIS